MIEVKREMKRRRLRELKRDHINERAKRLVADIEAQDKNKIKKVNETRPEARADYRTDLGNGVSALDSNVSVILVFFMFFNIYIHLIFPL